MTPSGVRVSSETQHQPRFSISQVSTLAASFEDDVRAYVEAGVDGIGVWEFKLGEGSLAEFHASGLGSATAVPSVPSVHPLPLLPGPDTVRERVDALRRAFDAMVKDPDYLAEAAKLRIELDPLPGIELQKVVEEVQSMPAEIVEKVKPIYPLN